MSADNQQERPEIIFISGILRDYTPNSNAVCANGDDIVRTVWRHTECVLSHQVSCESSNKGIERNSLSGKFRPARKAERSGNCLERVPGEITESVKTPINHGRTKRPCAALLYPDIESKHVLRSIGGTLRSLPFGVDGGDIEIPP